MRTVLIRTCNGVGRSCETNVRRSCETNVHLLSGVAVCDRTLKRNFVSWHVSVKSNDRFQNSSFDCRGKVAVKSALGFQNIQKSTVSGGVFRSFGTVSGGFFRSFGTISGGAFRSFTNGPEENGSNFNLARDVVQEHASRNVSS